MESGLERANANSPTRRTIKERPGDLADGDERSMACVVTITVEPGCRVWQATVTVLADYEGFRAAEPPTQDRERRSGCGKVEAPDDRPILASTAFTASCLTEIIVVVTLILLCVTKLIPAVNSVREALGGANASTWQLGTRWRTMRRFTGFAPWTVKRYWADPERSHGIYYSWMTQLLLLLDRKAVHTNLDYW